MKKRTTALADKTKIYDYDQFCKLIDEAKDSHQKKMLISDIILILFYSQKDKPIFGRTMLIKQLFLVFTEIMEKNKIETQNPKFVAHNFGPYSFTVMQIVDDLWFSHHLMIEGRKKSRKEAFSLTENGEKRAHELFTGLDPGLQKSLKQKRIGWDQLGTDGILNYVYEKYPKMTENSKIKTRYKGITWGK
ncbi:hypothetical protein [Methanoregula formicica]|uniref:Antitoxin SocA-like Panacea domain-containing protein n=1 Tax=Methanoregula formicica (strain DSM 22288 / NBRC 105244 / SMSP) TaxID=593750 RepID=L0HER0_METFS|nr:hypothetical protein [Methanoregula formicica]AGB02515.1 hypothetical protein Metfor_1481 [Methanoregula formicica SMSP]